MKLISFEFSELLINMWLYYDLGANMKVKSKLFSFLNDMSNKLTILNDYTWDYNINLWWWFSDSVIKI